MARCLVTLTDDAGERHTLEVEADTLHKACFRFNYEVVCGMGERRIPRPGPESVLEVQKVGEEKVHRVKWGRLMRRG